MTKLDQKNLLILVFVISFLCVITATAYSSVFFNFFNGDDFVHLTWLPLAIKHPELIYKNFYSSWLDGTTTRFYRPLISVFMVSDYLLWGTNGLGFRLTNLLFHLVSSIFIFLITKRLLSSTKNNSFAVSLFASSIFALYPLHPEAVSWITGRVDSVVTTFYLASFWFYIKSRQDKAKYCQILCAIAFILALLSKEMAVTLPVLFICYELFAEKFTQQEITQVSFVKKGLNALLATSPFWIILAIYFMVRRFALGTFVGGYDDSLFFVSNFKSYILNWIHAIRMMLIPINKDLLGSHSILTKTWEILLIAVILLLLIKFIRMKELRYPIIFTALWLIITLVPVYKIFAIADDLQGSRLAYLSTVPLSILFSYAFAWSKPVSIKHISNLFTVLLGTFFVIMCGILLSTNNQAYREAGLMSNTIRQSLANLYKNVDSDPETLLIGLPDHIHGAYVCRNALWGMLKKPQLHKDINNCLAINQFEPIFPFGYLKESIQKNQEKIKLFFWSNEKSDFIPISLANLENKSDKLVSTQNKFQEIIGNTNSNRPTFDLDFGPLSCWSSDFIAVSIELIDNENNAKNCGADILYTNDLQPEFNLAHRTHCPIDISKKKQTLLFSLRSLPVWACGNKCKSLRLLLPPHYNFKITSIAIIPKEFVLPNFSFANSGYLGSKGYLHLNKDLPYQTLNIDVSKIAQAGKYAIEITKNNLLFEEQNCLSKSPTAAKFVIKPDKQGQFVLNKNDFQQTGIYELRIWALDNANNLLGVSSDHIVISVNP
jgi:hypothetical protein